MIRRWRRCPFDKMAIVDRPGRDAQLDTESVRLQAYETYQYAQNTASSKDLHGHKKILPKITDNEAYDLHVSICEQWHAKGTRTAAAIKIRWCKRSARA